MLTNSRLTARATQRRLKQSMPTPNRWRTIPGRRASQSTMNPTASLRSPVTTAMIACSSCSTSATTGRRSRCRPLLAILTFAQRRRYESDTIPMATTNPASTLSSIAWLSAVRPEATAPQKTECRTPYSNRSSTADSAASMASSTTSSASASASSLVFR